VPDLKECFVISPIGQEGSDTRTLADDLLTYIVTPPLKEFGYHTVRADHLETGGDISDQVIEHLRDAPLAIAILHGSNPNVYYEMAVRHALAKPLIPLAAAGAALPFDIRGMRTVFVDMTKPASVEQARTQIAGQVRGFEKDPLTVINPVTRVLSGTARWGM
jgi:hypothetical protein